MKLKQETQDLIAAYRRNPSGENRAALRRQVAKNYDTFVADEYIGRLHVAVENAALVGVGKRPTDSTVSNPLPRKQIAAYKE